ncbi:MAG: Mrp/NBP35 family ATP-binding protein [Chloroflexi bacterium]|nr:Mrp/NBP35 family ATP-binding protein [Chloroflexota bacterium]
MQALRGVIDPDLQRDVVSLNMIREVAVGGDGTVSFRFVLTTPACPVRADMEASARQRVAALPGVRDVRIQMDAEVPRRGTQQQNLLPGVRNIVAVASGKGGVGKSTVSVNLAVALAQTGARVGLLDADIYGPNIPQMMGARSAPQVVNDRLLPVEAHGVKIMSIGFLVRPDEAMIMRGPMASGALQQLMRDVDWGELDYLLVDMPPGTGDIALTLAQATSPSGAVIVCTPQDVAWSDAVRAIGMFGRVNVPILGLIENMSYFVCPHCGERTEIFSHGGGPRQAAALNVPFLGEVPLETAIRVGGDEGEPITVGRPDSPVARAFHAIAGQLAANISTRQFRALPVISVR